MKQYINIYIHLITLKAHALIIYKGRGPPGYCGGPPGNCDGNCGGPPGNCDGNCDGPPGNCDGPPMKGGGPTRKCGGNGMWRRHSVGGVELCDVTLQEVWGEWNSAT